MKTKDEYRQGATVNSLAKHKTKRLRARVVSVSADTLVLEFGPGRTKRYSYTLFAKHWFVI